jgi:hypothetical protein
MKYTAFHNSPGNQASLRVKALCSLAIIISLVVIYHLNGDVLPGNDATPNIYLSVSLLEDGNLSYEPLEFPSLFRDWRYRGYRIKGPASQLRPDARINGISAEKLHKQKKITHGDHKYFLTPTVTENIYANTFGIGSGLTMLPAALWLKIFNDEWPRDHEALWKAGKFTAALLVALSAALLFLCCCHIVGVGPAFLLAVAYGLGTGVWSISSQTLWQHGPNAFFLAFGTWFFLKTKRNPAWALGCGAAYGYAVLCRPTSAVMVVAAGMYLLIVNRKALLYYIAGGLPMFIVLVSYNYHYFGAPFEFGQLKVSGVIAEYKTGSSDIWQNSVLLGAAGLMFSPSRGILPYSPFLAGVLFSFFSFWGKREWLVMLPLALGSLIIFLVAGKWFDWWGGWCYGYRPVVDLAFFGVLLLTPITGWIFAKRRRFIVFVLLIAWSVFVQFLGAFAYNLSGWNDPVAYKLILPGDRKKVVREHSTEKVTALAREMGVLRIEQLNLDVDLPENRDRLWSITDNQILYYMTNYSKARRRKRALARSWLKEPVL